MLYEFKSMFEKQDRVERFDLIQTFHACKQVEGKPVAAYVLQMKGYVDQLERLGYMLPQNLVVGLLLNGLTKDFTGFVRNYNMHNMENTIGELHAMLIEYEKGLPKKAETPQVMMIKGESATRILNMVPTKKVDKTPYELWSERTHQAPNRLCLNVKVDEHSLGDLNKPASYKAAMLDSESNKWIDAMNAKIQSMIDNMVWILVDFPPGSVYYDYEIWQMDLKTAFLNGYLDEDIYMVQLEAEWKSSNQSTTAMSATEAEYIDASVAAMEAIWIRKFISGLGIVTTISKPIRMFCDNSAALHFAKELGVQRGARHYHRRYHYVRESIALGGIKFLKVHTDDNLADPFTKDLSNTKLT
uniref:Zinc finger, CCHC-type n=1 Tax=Tanacetum cinerariifolium TaxID=118510 RepID=A0A699HE18_TANCI|nr:zinc finger, CCHC-type [Tanacetum cinerariifolium]